MTLIASPVVPTRGRLRPLALGEVTITGGFWAERQHVNGTATLAHIEHWLEREGWIGNFDLAAAGELPDGRRGREFSDSEVYKYLEAVAWEIGRTGDPALEDRFRKVAARVAAAQEPDGYLNTKFGRPGQGERWSALEWGHELYCIGHLLQAAVARARTRPDADDGLVEVARRAADLVCVVFGPGGIESVCGHAEIEPALVEFARVTGDERYLDQAALFVERRGRGTLRDIEFGRSYYQDDVPVRDATVLRGHAVRAGYLAAGAVDVAVERGDEELLAALVTQWHNTVARRTYLTGGVGSHHQDEAFGDDWVLPPDRAYSETCASVASIMFSWRLLLARGSAHYADLIERNLVNVVATSSSAEGTAFFYANTLHQRTPGTPAAAGELSPRASSSVRAPWFEVSCCPPNVARTLASLAAYVATVDDDGLQLHQYAPAAIRTTLPSGMAIALDVETGYPRDGVIRVRVREDAAAPWTLSLRVPAWAEGARLVVDGSEEAVTPGTALVRRAFRAGDVVELHLPVTPRFTAADPRIDAVRGCLAVERGPEVLCLESVDLVAASAGRVDDISGVRLDPAVAPRDVDGAVVVRLRRSPAHSRPWPYGGPDAEPAGAGETFDVPLVPYHDWAERGPSTMRVWLPA
ncbi:glycoside hydrolase family 127 protein [Pseudonocardia sp. DSM 110487]|uniref:glycoside hydrolase family 127 protein n=1 Tax=Pseudonocardia sp. DSM 110487 TaxID=2865833 RepID=UPI001C69EC3D|nr:beta-L-arabinofuranosidase domain-containing protein [Pseudonocardia sp. DSM 110487]QYN32343.1 glycoside hydrolase family 127 protein [Pseudonocardia sp. DSM 110487]